MMNKKFWKIMKKFWMTLELDENNKPERSCGWDFQLFQERSL